MKDFQFIFLITFILLANVISAQKYEYEIGGKLSPGYPDVSIIGGVHASVDFLTSSNYSFTTKLNYDAGTFRNDKSLLLIKGDSFRLFSVEEIIKFKFGNNEIPHFIGIGLGYYKFTELIKQGNSGVPVNQFSFNTHVGLNSLIGTQIGISQTLAVYIYLKLLMIPSWQKSNEKFKGIPGELTDEKIDEFIFINCLSLNIGLAIKDY